MSKALAISRKAHHIAIEHNLELARSAIVLGCAAALILAGQPLPY